MSLISIKMANVVEQNFFNLIVGLNATLNLNQIQFKNRQHLGFFPIIIILVKKNYSKTFTIIFKRVKVGKNITQPCFIFASVNEIKAPLARRERLARGVSVQKVLNRG